MKMYYSLNKTSNIDWNNKSACFALSFDCDLKEDYEAMPALLETLSQYSLKATFACIGKWIEIFPEIHKEMIDAGHELMNHTYTHPDSEYFHQNRKFSSLTKEERKLEILKADEVFKKLLGYKPIGFRTPHFGTCHTIDIYGILKDLGYKYSSSVVSIKTPSYGNPFKTSDGIIEFPLSMSPDNIFSCFDTWKAFKGPRGMHTAKSEAEFFKNLIWVIETGIKNNSFINVYFDPYDVILLKGLKDFFSFLSVKKDEIWIARYQDIMEKIS